MGFLRKLSGDGNAQEGLRTTDLSQMSPLDPLLDYTQVHPATGRCDCCLTTRLGVPQEEGGVWVPAMPGAASALQAWAPLSFHGNFLTLRTQSF